MRAMGKELRGTLVLAVPIILGQLGQMLMPLIDAAMVGRLGVTPLAAVAFGNLVVWIPMIAGFGICVSVHVLVASAHAAGEREEPVALSGIETNLPARWPVLRSWRCVAAAGTGAYPRPHSAPRRQGFL